jgi:hypothetical protein
MLMLSEGIVNLQHAHRYLGMIALVIAAALGTPAGAQAPSNSEPDRIRGQITQVDGSSIVVKTAKGVNLRMAFPESAAIFSLTPARFADVDFGTYVGAVSVKLGDNIYSPIVRDSLSWLHKSFEFRVIDEKLRGIAVGHTKWDLTPESVMTHGWIDDMEGRVVSIKYGPTEEEETDVEISRDTPVTKMSLGDKSLVKSGAGVMVGAQKGTDGNYTAVFIFVGKDGIVPPM